MIGVFGVPAAPGLAAPAKVKIVPPAEMEAMISWNPAHLPGAINILNEKIGETLDRIRGMNVVFYGTVGGRCASAYFAAEDAGVKTTRYLNRNVDFASDGSFTIN